MALDSDWSKQQNIHVLTNVLAYSIIIMLSEGIFVVI